MLTVKWLLLSRVTDVDLDEDEVLKLASFGNGANNKDTIDVLRKSMVMRNRLVIQILLFILWIYGACS